MIIDIKPLAEGKNLGFLFDETIHLDKSYNLNDYNAKVKVKGDILKQGSLYICKAQVTLKVDFLCDKCLSLVTQILDFPIEEKFCNTEYLNTNNEEEITHFLGTEIDVKDITISNISFNMPMQVVCKQNCKGLCPNCGSNLNENGCSCNNVVFNTKFEALRSLFNNDEEV